MSAPMSLPLNTSTGARLVAVDGRPLPLRSTSLTTTAKAGLARVVLQQKFFNPYSEPLRVTYSLPLPADGAVSGFAFIIGTERVVGQVDTKQKARERFEEAILEGRTAALLEQERSSLFTQEVGNVPPLTEVVCEITVDQKLVWLADGLWEWRFPTVVAPRYMGAPNSVPDSTRVNADVADGPLPIRMSLQLSIRDALTDAARPVSPSHSLHTARGAGSTEVNFADDAGQALDRDVVIRWKVARLAVGVTLDVGRPVSAESAGTAYGLVTLVPPEASVPMTPVPRDLIVLLDTSGSMSGEPLNQARRIVSALVDSLNDADQLEIIEFSYAPRSWKNGAVAATAKNRKDAQNWLAGLRASSSTEMHTAMMAALAPLRAEAQRQVVLITDGLIGNEAAILGEIVNRLPANCRVHTVGIGSGVNRSLTSPAARAGRGTEINIATGEDAEVAAARILLRTAKPLVTELRISGSALESFAPARLADLYAGSPSLISVKVKTTGGTLRVTGKTADGEFTQELEVGDSETQTGTAALAALYARELVEDLELRRAAGEGSPVLDRQVETLGLTFQISTRLTSWVAVSAKVMVDPTAPRRTENVPHELAHDLSAEGVGLRASQGVTLSAPAMDLMSAGGALRAEAAPSMANRSAVKMSKRAAPAKAESAAPPPPPARPAAPSGASAPVSRERLKEVMRADEGSADDDAEMVEEKTAPEPVQAPAPKKSAPREVMEKLKSVFGLSVGGATKADATKSKRVLRGRVVLLKDGRMSIEVVVDGDVLNWAPVGEVRLDLKSGGVLVVKVNTSLTTRAGQYQAGLQVMLVVDVPAGQHEISRAVVMSGGELIEIVC